MTTHLKISVIIKKTEFKDLLMSKLRIQEPFFPAHHVTFGLVHVLAKVFASEKEVTIEHVKQALFLVDKPFRTVAQSTLVGILEGKNKEDLHTEGSPAHEPDTQDTGGNANDNMGGIKNI